MRCCALEIAIDPAGRKRDADRHVGLGRMGGNMVARLREHGHTVVGYDAAPGVGDVSSLDELVAALDDQRPRVVWVMVPAGSTPSGSASSTPG